MAEKRLKKNISFSDHERDIYEYLDTVGNASAFIKRLILNHMMMEQGVTAPKVVIQQKEQIPRETMKPRVEVPQETMQPQFTDADKENQSLLPDY